MSKLKLSMALSKNSRTQPLADGKITADGIDFTTSTIHPSELFWRQMKFQEFDVSEMSLSSLLIMTARKDNPWVALPIFTTRYFFHAQILVNKNSGIEKPEDLKGKRVGVPEYQQTAALWGRGALKHEFGVEPEDMHWFMERSEDLSHGGVTGFRPNENVRLERIPAEKNIGSMIMSGEIDASLVYLAERNLVDRTHQSYNNHDQIRTLFPDPIAESVRYYEKTNIFPINHCVVVRKSILESNPWIALNIFNAFQQAKSLLLEQIQDYSNLSVNVGKLSAGQRQSLMEDPIPYGYQVNRHILETLSQYSYEQGLTPERIPIETLFAPSTLHV